MRLFNALVIEISMLKNRGTPRTTSLAREATSDRKSRNLVSLARDHFDLREASQCRSNTRVAPPNAFLGSVPTSPRGTTFDPLAVETLTWFDRWIPGQNLPGGGDEKNAPPSPFLPRIYNTRTTVLGFICDRLLWKIPEHRSFRWSFVTRIAHESGPFSSWLFVSR